MSLLVERPDPTTAPAPAAPARPRRRGRALLAAGVALVGALAIALALTGGSDAAPEGPLAWAEDPLVFTPERLPGDRIATGSVEGAELREGRVYATKMVVVDADGRE